MKAKFSIALVILVNFLLADYALSNTIQIVDTEGRRVVIPNKVQRAVVLTGTCIETINILGAMDRVIGISKNIKTHKIFERLIPDLKQKEVVGEGFRAYNMERIMALKPDLLITIGPDHPLGMSEKDVKRLENQGIPVVLLNIDEFPEFFTSIEVLGMIFDSYDKAKALKSYLYDILQYIQSKIATIKENDRVRAIYTSGNSPNYVYGGYWQDFNVIRLAGGINCAESIKQFMATVSYEHLNIWNPDVITITANAKYSVDDVLSMPQLKFISAIRTKRVFKNPPEVGGMYTPRLPLLVAWHASKYYPFLGIRWNDIAKEFFKKFYGYDYNVEQK